ncbi:hypothetical protein D3C78_1789950 [compost metagenome]
MESIKVNDRYEVFVEYSKSNSVFEAKRYGEPWRDLTGDNLALSMFYRIQELEEEITLLKEKREL